jgi:hypothetical protein
MLERLKKKQAYLNEKVASEEPFINIVRVILLRVNEDVAQFKLSNNTNNHKQHSEISE